jgi:Flp pilus assembly protein TadG
MFLTLCLGIIDGGRAFYYREAVTNAAREALRVAQSTGQQANANTVCGGTGLGTATAHIPMQGAETTGPLATIATRAGLESSGNGSTSTSAVARPTTTVTVIWHCNGASAYTKSTATNSDPASSSSDSVEVRVSYTFTLLTPLVDRLFPNHTISSDVFGRVDYP